MNLFVSSEYLKNNASEAIYESIRHKLEKAARKLNVTLKPDFGLKPVVVRPNIVEHVVSAGIFTV